jgi:hypothetical protein
MNLAERYDIAESEYTKANEIITAMMLEDNADYVAIEQKEKELKCDELYQTVWQLEKELTEAIFEAMKAHDKNLYNEYTDIRKNDPNIFNLYREDFIKVGKKLIK